MSWDVTIAGQIVLPVAKQAAWEMASADPAIYSDWKDPINLALGGEPRSVAQLLREVAAWSKGNQEGFAELTVKNDLLTLRAFLSEYDFGAFGPSLLSALRATGPFGGKGRLTVADAGGAPGHLEVKVANGTSTVASKRNHGTRADIAMHKNICERMLASKKNRHPTKVERDRSMPQVASAGTLTQERTLRLLNPSPAGIAVESELEHPERGEKAIKHLALVDSPLAYELMQPWFAAGDLARTEQALWATASAKEAENVRLRLQRPLASAPIDKRWLALAEEVLRRERVENERPGLAMAAVEVLHMFGGAAGDVVLEFLQSPLAQLRERAEDWLVRHQEPRLKPILLERLAAEKNPSERQAIQYAIDSLEPDHEGREE